MKFVHRSFIALVLTVAIHSFARTIHVPKDEPSIQGGIDAASNGDTVLVAPGTYNEDINFNGKAITVASSNGPTVTTIHGDGEEQVVTFAAGEAQPSVLRGFTITNGFACCNNPAGGISIYNSSPKIVANILTKNAGCGIAVYYGAPIIENNIISFSSTTSACPPAQGSGILLYGQGTPYGMGSVQIIGNIITHNGGPYSSWGAGIYLWIGGAPLIQNNIIAWNEAANNGGGITMQNSGAPLIVQNLIVDNKAETYGGGLDLEIPDDGSTAVMVNNTIAGNTTVNSDGQTGPEVYLSGFYGTVTFWNNIITGATENAVVFGDPLYRAPSPSFNHNDAFSTKGGAYAGTCAGETGKKGNLSANPKFADPAKEGYQLQKGSPAINAGTNAAPHIPPKDLAGHPRIVGGIIDMGAYEYQGK